MVTGNVKSSRTKGKQKKGNAEGIAGSEANHTLGDGFTTIFIEVHLRPAREPTNAQNLGHHREGPGETPRDMGVSVNFRRSIWEVIVYWHVYRGPVLIETQVITVGTGFTT